MTTHPLHCLWPPPLSKYLLVTWWIIHRMRIQNSVVSRGQYSTCRGHQKLEEEKCICKAVENKTPGIFSTTLCLNFQRRKGTRGSIFNVEKWTPGQFSTRIKILRYTGTDCWWETDALSITTTHIYQLEFHDMYTIMNRIRLHSYNFPSSLEIIRLTLWYIICFQKCICNICIWINKSNNINDKINK
jgi:hypothetical protein